MAIKEILLEDLKVILITIGSALASGLILFGPAFLALHTENSWFFLLYLLMALLSYGLSAIYRMTD